MTKCSKCRFRAKVDGKEVEGRIAVESDYLRFLYSQGDEICYSILMSYYRKHGVGDFFQDFEIVPRAPETYQDWQVGDIACEEEHRNARYEVIFRSGELVFFKDWNNYATNPFTCSEAFRRFGFRLVLTDIERQIIEERERAKLRAGKSEVKSEIKSNVHHELKKGEPVLVRDSLEGKWFLYAFVEHNRSGRHPFRANAGGGEVGFNHCIPYNERTMHLLGTTEDYREEQL